MTEVTTQLNIRLQKKENDVLYVDVKSFEIKLKFVIMHNHEFGYLPNCKKGILEPGINFDWENSNWKQN